MTGTTGDDRAALQAFVKNEYLAKTSWIKASRIETLQLASLKAAAVAKEEAAGAKRGAAAAQDAAAGKLTVADGLDEAGIRSCSATRVYLASGFFVPDSLPEEPMDPPKVRECNVGIEMHECSVLFQISKRLCSHSPEAPAYGRSALLWRPQSDQRGRCLLHASSPLQAVVC